MASRIARFGKKTQHRQTVATDNRCVLYIRASTDKQANSLDAQRRRAEEFAEAKHLDIDEVFIDAGVSAVHNALLDRPEAKRMLSHLQRRGIATILVLRMDRAFRSSLDFSLTTQRGLADGFHFRFIEPDIDYGTPMGRMFAQLEVARAEMECAIREQRVEDALDSLRQRRLSRNGNAAGYGWEAEACADGTVTRQGNGQFRHLPVPAEQAVLRHMMHRWDQLGGRHGALTIIATELNDLGIRTKMAGKTMTKHGRTFVCSGEWQAGNVKSVLAHAVLATDAELPDGLPDLETAAAILNGRAGDSAHPTH